jgi:hypothetical protein
MEFGERKVNRQILDLPVELGNFGALEAMPKFAYCQAKFAGNGQDGLPDGLNLKNAQ